MGKCDKSKKVKKTKTPKFTCDKCGVEAEKKKHVCKPRKKKSKK